MKKRKSYSYEFYGNKWRTVKSELYGGISSMKGRYRVDWRYPAADSFELINNFDEITFGEVKKFNKYTSR